MKSRLWIITVVVSALLCAGCTTGGRKDVPGISNFGEVTTDIWRGGKPMPEGMKWLSDRGVKTIIDLQMEDYSEQVPAGVRYVPIRVSLWRCDCVDVPAVLRAIEESPKPVFIHCLVGRDRTGLAVAAWQMSHQGMTAEQAIGEMEKFGSSVWSPAIKRRIRQLEQEAANSAVKSTASINNP